MLSLSRTRHHRGGHGGPSSRLLDGRRRRSPRHPALRHRFRRQLAGVLAKRGGRRKPADVDEVAAATAQTLLDLAFSRWIDRHGRGSLTHLVDTVFSTLDGVTGEATESTEIA